MMTHRHGYVLWNGSCEGARNERKRVILWSWLWLHKGHEAHKETKMHGLAWWRKEKINQDQSRILMVRTLIQHFTTISALKAWGFTFAFQMWHLLRHISFMRKLNFSSTSTIKHHVFKATHRANGNSIRWHFFMVKVTERSRVVPMLRSGHALWRTTLQQEQWLK